MTAADFMIGVAAVGLVSLVLAVGCVADKILEHIPAVERFIRSLPLGRSEK